jgi:dihydroorotate dehydrogenase electron transfer subunit
LIPAFIRVVSTERLYGDTYITWFDGPELLRAATPGRFLMLRCASLADQAAPPTGASLANDPLLPRAMSYHRIREGDSGREFSILYDVVGRGTAWLAAREPGDLVYAWGPLGRGYSLRAPGSNLLLVGGGIGIAPLLWLADEAVAKGKSVVLIIGARTAEGVFPTHLVPPEVEVVVTTEDGSMGRSGRATDAFAEYFNWADQVFTCGPNAMFAALAELVHKLDGPQRTRSSRAARTKPVQALLEAPMGCGTGICYGCAVIDRRGEPRLVCKDGPRFDIRDIW